MRAEEGDESVNDYANEAEQTHDYVLPGPAWLHKLKRALTFWRGGES